jgi:alanine dehydrogenase
MKAYLCKEKIRRMKLKIGLIREEKNPPDTRVVLTPDQCAGLKKSNPELEICVEPSSNRCISDEEYINAGLQLQTDLSDCDILLGVKEVPAGKLIPGKTYFFFSHTKKKQAYNQHLMQVLIEKKIRMIDYEALTYDDGKRIIGFGFYAGVVGAHNGLLTYGKKFKAFTLLPAHDCASMQEMTDQYLEIKLPPVKIALTGSGKVAAGLLEIMHSWDIESVEPGDFLKHSYAYPVYTHLKGGDLYQHAETGLYDRNEFHQHPEKYKCLFPGFVRETDILLNGIYWDERIPRLFERSAVQQPDFRISVIADVTCDINGSVPINLAASTISDPVYGIRKSDFSRTEPFQNNGEVIDIMAVDNLPNELPRDASEHFGAHIIKYILPELFKTESAILDRATICRDGSLTSYFEYLSDYAYV